MRICLQFVAKQFLDNNSALLHNTTTSVQMGKRSSESDTWEENDQNFDRAKVQECPVPAVGLNSFLSMHRHPPSKFYTLQEVQIFNMLPVLLRGIRDRLSCFQKDLAMNELRVLFCVSLLHHHSLVVAAYNQYEFSNYIKTNKKVISTYRGSSFSQHICPFQCVECIYAPAHARGVYT